MNDAPPVTNAVLPDQNESAVATRLSLSLYLLPCDFIDELREFLQLFDSIIGRSSSPGSIAHCSQLVHIRQEHLDDAHQLGGLVRVRDRDGSYGERFREVAHWLGIREVLTAPQSPWQNADDEPLIGSIRRECLNHYVILNARHLRRTLALYFSYYHESRPHLGLGKQCPFPRQVLSVGKVIAIPQLEGLHHRYERVAA